MNSKIEEQSHKNRRLLIWAASLTFFFAGLEIVYGMISGSLMMMGDGVHMSSDAISLVLSLVAVILSTKAATKNKTFGYKRFEPIAAFINGLTLIIIPIFIIIEAINRIITPIDIVTNQMLIVGTIGLIVNVIVGFILTRANSNLNIKSALLHVVADLITSVSVVIAALGIKYFSLTWLDPIGSILTSFIIIAGGVKITKEALNILMEGTPKGYSVEEIEKAVHNTGTDVIVDDVKVWCVNEEEVYTLINIKTSAEKVYRLQKEIKERISNSFKIASENIYININ